MENNVMNEVTNETVKATEDTILGLNKADFMCCVKEGIIVGITSYVTNKAMHVVTDKISKVITDRKMKKEAAKDPKPEAETVVDGDFSEVEPE